MFSYSERLHKKSLKVISGTLHRGERQNLEQGPLMLSAKETIVSHLTVKLRGPELPISRPHIKEPRRPEVPNLSTAHMQSLHLSPSAPQYQQGRKKQTALY